MYLKHILLSQQFFLLSFPTRDINKQLFSKEKKTDEKSIVDRSSDHDGHRIGPPRLIICSGKVANTCVQTYFLKQPGVLSCWNKKCQRIAIRTSFRLSRRNSFQRVQEKQPSRIYKRMYVPSKQFRTVPVQMLIIKFHSETEVYVACAFSPVRVCKLWTVTTPSRKNISMNRIHG